MEMYGETCNIPNEVRGWFKDPKSEDMGSWVLEEKKLYLQGFVTDNPLTKIVRLENPNSRFIIGSDLPGSAGIDGSRYGRTAQQITLLVLTLNKTFKGGYADYPTPIGLQRAS